MQHGSVGTSEITLFLSVIKSRELALEHMKKEKKIGTQWNMIKRFRENHETEV